MLPDGVGLQALIDLRRQLHQLAELSGHEVQTSRVIQQFLADCHPQDIWRGIGGQGVAAVFDSGKAGPSILFRAELDAIAICEETNLPWRSLSTQAAHKCGHDGHMSILVGIAQHLKAHPPKRGQVVLLFQPAEETGQGAELVASDPRIRDLKPDRIFALHNLPGYPAGEILIRGGAFCAGSCGLTVRLNGQTSHAAYPEQGLPCDLALAELVTGLSTLPIPLEKNGKLALVTVGHARLGQPSFGITPCDAEILATLRSDQDETQALLKSNAVTLAQEVAQRHSLKMEYSWSEEFPVTYNDPVAAREIEGAARNLGLNFSRPDESPFRWSEDFGHLLQLGSGAMFGLGSGMDHPPLHAQDYDFNEDLLEIGVAMFASLLPQ